MQPPNDSVVVHPDAAGSADAQPAFIVGPTREYFLDPEWHRRDLEQVFRPTWHLAGHVSDLAENGSFLTFSLGTDEVVVVRVGSELRAYMNFCRHRGHRLCTTERGKLKSPSRLICPYHGWSFSADDGECLTAVRMPEDFDRSTIPLISAHVATFHGLVFVSLADEPTPLQELTADVDLGGYDLERMRIAATRVLDIDANWKLVVENNSECYHCTLNHPELIRRQDPWGTTGAQEEWGKRYLSDRDKPATYDWDTLGFGDDYWRNADSVCKMPLPRTSDEPGESYRVGWNPNGLIVFMPEYAFSWNVKPGTGPENSLVTMHWLVHEDAVEGRDYQLQDVQEFFGDVIGQDVPLCEESQRGLRMGTYTPGPLHPQYQGGGIALYLWYARRMGITY